MHRHVDLRPYRCRNRVSPRRHSLSTERSPRIELAGPVLHRIALNGESCRHLRFKRHKKSGKQSANATLADRAAGDRETTSAHSIHTSNNIEALSSQFDSRHLNACLSEAITSLGGRLCHPTRCLNSGVRLDREGFADGRSNTRVRQRAGPQRTSTCRVCPARTVIVHRITEFSLV
jgi:hypothetical protein